MPLALLAIGSELDPDVYEVVTIDARLDPDAERTVLSHIGDALCIGITVLTGAPISDALRISRAAKTRASDDTRRLGRLASIHVRARMSAREIGGRHGSRPG